MRTAALAVTILIVLVMFFGPAGFIVGVAVVAAVPLLRRSERRARVIAAAWLVGGALLAVGWMQLAWRLGVLLYAIGAVRAHLVRPADAAFAVASLALAALLGWREAHDLLVAELASAAALAIGAALARSTGLADLTRPQRVE